MYEKVYGVQFVYARGFYGSPGVGDSAGVRRRGIQVGGATGEDVTAYMDGFASATNSFVNPYVGVTGNSNSYASRLVEGFGFASFDPHLSAPGSGGGRVLKEFRCEGP